MSDGFRYFAGALAFGFAAVWIMASLAGALVCLLSAAAVYGAIVGAERMRAKRTVRSPSVSPASRLKPSSQTSEGQHFAERPDALNRDLGYVYEPATSSHASGAPYGWPAADDGERAPSS